MNILLKSLTLFFILFSVSNAEIIKGINLLYSNKFQKKIKSTKNPYGEGGASKKIIKILMKTKLENILKKKFYSLK